MQNAVLTNVLWESWLADSAHFSWYDSKTINISEQHSKIHSAWIIDWIWAFNDLELHQSMQADRNRVTKDQ